MIELSSESVKYSTWGVRRQRWNSKELTGARTSGGTCGLIRWYARNLTRAWTKSDECRDALILRTLLEVLHGCRQLVPWGVGLSAITSATLFYVCHRVMPGTPWILPPQGGGRWGWRQISTALTSGATHVLQWSEQQEATWRQDADPETRPQFGLESATRLHEAGFASNRASAMARWIRSRALYTPPVKPWKPGVPEVRDRKDRPRAKLVIGAKS